MCHHLLLIEDDLSLGAGLQQFLQEAGYPCDWCQQADQVAALWYQADLVILDRQLADGDSLRHLPQWLARKALPVVILTARVTLEDRISGLDAGARDYLSKPFSHAELLARIRAQLRPLGDGTLRTAQLRLHPSTLSCIWQGENIALTRTEFALLQSLAQLPGRVFTREELLNQVWGYNHFPSTRTVDTHVLQLRQKLPGLPLESIRKVGYRLKETP